MSSEAARVTKSTDIDAATVDVTTQLSRDGSDANFFEFEHIAGRRETPLFKRVFAHKRNLKRTQVR